MGFFSWKCSVSGESIANTYAGKGSDQSDCYLITPTKTYHEPSYEGYGDFDGHDVYDLLGDGDRDKGIDLQFNQPEKLPFEIKLVLAKHYEGQAYEDLKPSESCPYQGYFYDF